MSEKKAPRIFTHRRVDLDACLSVAAVREFVPGFRKAEVIFVDIDFGGEGMKPQDMALDIEAGGKGIKGFREDSGVTHSCFATIMRQFACKTDQFLLRHLISYVDSDDATGRPLGNTIISVEREDGEAKKVFRARKEYARRFVVDQTLKVQFGDLEFALEANPDRDKMMCTIFGNLFRAKLIKKRAEAEAREVAESVELIGSGDARVALVEENGSKLLTSAIMTKTRVAFVVSVQGTMLSVLRNHNENRLGLDHPKVLQVITDAGEKVAAGQWFLHTAGYLLTWGNMHSKDLPEHSSKVDPRKLAEAITEALAEEAKSAAA